MIVFLLQDDNVGFFIYRYNFTEYNMRLSRPEFVVLLVLVSTITIIYLSFGRQISESYKINKYPIQPSLSSYLLREDHVPSYTYINQFVKLDESILIDLSKFKFTMNHDKCQKVLPIIVILVHSAPQNFAKRSSIRKTWGQKNRYTATFFLVGFSTEYNNMIEKENKNYADVIQGNFVDSYRNMTYKHAMAFKWIIYHCPGEFNIIL